MIVPKAGVSYREMVTGGRFYYGAEIVTTRGIPVRGSPNRLLDLAQLLLADPRIGWISITDNPGGVPMLPPDWLAGLLSADRSQVVLHLTCKDMNRNGLEAAAWHYAAEGFDNLLALTGDYPTAGFGGVAAPVFDLDSVGLVRLLRSMNEGLEIPARQGGVHKLPSTHFFIGCVVSPFKRQERELLPQYFKLFRKIRAGAHWVIPQLGYDMRKFHEVKLVLASRGIQVPVLGNAHVLNRAVARLFNSGKLPGCVVTDELMARADRYSAGPDRGRRFFYELAARQLAVFKGLGFAGGYLGGLSQADAFGDVIELAESYAPDDWREFIKEIQFSQPDEFFLFEHDPHTGLSDPTRINPQYLKSLQRPPRSREVTLGYRFSRWVHNWLFTRGKGLYRVMQRIYARWDKRPGVLSRLAYWLERQSKHLGYGCQDCGDCSLADCAFLCPLAGCPKQMRLGPCGGSCAGRCELGDRDCFWARVYDRLKYYGESPEMFAGPIVLYDAQLRHTSSWANTYLDRDHVAARDRDEGHAPSPAAQSEEAQQQAEEPPSQTAGRESQGPAGE